MLDLGDTLQLLFLQSGSTLTFSNIGLIGVWPGGRGVLG